MAYLAEDTSLKQPNGKPDWDMRSAWMARSYGRMTGDPPRATRVGSPWPR